MTLTEPRSDLDRLRARRDAGRLVPHQARPVSRAIELGGAALYTAAMPRGARPWERSSHAVQGIYLERARTVLDSSMVVEELARVLAAHEGCTEQAAAVRAWAVGDPS